MGLRAPRHRGLPKRRMAFFFLLCFDRTCSVTWEVEERKAEGR